MALAVATDAVAVAVSAGIARGRVTWAESLRMAAVFGLFQAAMPALGFAGGVLFHGYIEAYDHWVAFVLLAAVGGHMIVESRRPAEAPPPDPFGARSLAILGFATSIDALAVGLSLAMLDFPWMLAVAIIGATTFILCLPAARLGARLGQGLARRAECVGGLVLIAIGMRILIEHLSGAA
ncbi:MAG TPA: manganese efflux pump MntP family protein [Usitatibacter sp.]|nr:manganese efflux pump MntP family protein [Usitatibacter sp.]